MKKTWNVNVNGVSHTIEYIAKWGLKVSINGETHKIKSQNWFVNTVDYPIKIDDTELRVVAVGNKVDLAVNGIYQDSGESYTPLHKVPILCNVLVAISFIAGWFLCGLIGMVIAVLFAQIYLRQGLAQKMGPVIGAFIGCTIIQVILMYVIYIIVY